MSPFDAALRGVAVRGAEAPWDVQGGTPRWRHDDTLLFTGSVLVTRNHGISTMWPHDSKWVKSDLNKPIKSCFSPHLEAQTLCASPVGLSVKRVWVVKRLKISWRTFLEISCVFVFCPVRLRQVREMHHGQEWTKESAVMSQSSLRSCCRLTHAAEKQQNLHVVLWRWRSVSMQGTQRTHCLRTPFLLLYAAVGSSTRSWAPGGARVKGDPASLHGSLVRPVPQGEDPRDSGVTHRYAQPLTEEGAAPAWNPILLTHGPGHPHQLSCGWWGGCWR